MGRSIAGNFVQSLKEKISLERDKEQKKRIHLQDSLNIILNVFRDDTNLEIRTIRDFETSEVACFVDVYSPDDFRETLASAFDQGGVPYNSELLNDYKFVFVIDLGDKIISSGSVSNIFSIEVFSRRLKTYKIKISPCDSKFSYSVYDKGYHEIKYWFHENMEIQKSFVQLRGINRDKKKHKITDDNNGHQIAIELDTLGEMESFILSHKGRRKIDN
jgi:hypothetical protein